MVKTQTDLSNWVRVKRPKNKSKAPKHAYRLLIDLSEGLMLPDGKTFPPIKRGDIISENALPDAVWSVLLSRGAVEHYSISL